MPKISPFSWFDTQAEEAVNFYISVFNEAPHTQQDSRIVSIARYEKGMEVPGAEQMEGKVLTAIFELSGQKFMALDGGPIFKFNEAVSFQVNCDSQEEVDYFWSKLSEGGDKNAQQCGWLKDKFGASWQIVPRGMAEMLAGDPTKARRAFEVMMEMKKLDINELRRAYNA